MKLKWYSLIDRGARDSVCERNSKKSPLDERACMRAHVYVCVGGEGEEVYGGVEAQSQKIALRAQ